jgi:hypothetical protein
VVNFFGDRWLYLSVNGYLWVMMACVVRAQIIVDEGVVLKATESLAASNEEAIDEEPVYA